MAMPSSTRYFTSSFVAMLVVVAIIIFSSLRLESLEPSKNFLTLLSCCHSICKHRLRLRARWKNAMKKDADDCGGQFGCVRINAGLMPFVSPVHHAEEAEDRHARVDTGREDFGGDGVEDFASERVIAALDGLHLFAVGVAEGVFFVREDLHLVGMRKEIFDVVEDEEAEAFYGFMDAVEPGPDAFVDKGKGCALNEIEEMVLAFKVVVEAREGNTGGTADIAHGGALKAVLGKDLGCGAQYVLEVGLGVAWDGNGGNHRRLERSFDKCSSWG